MATFGDLLYGNESAASYDVLDNATDVSEVVLSNVTSRLPIDHHRYMFRFILNVPVSMPITILGIIANLVEFTVLCHQKSKRSTTILMQGLAVIDIMVHGVGVVAVAVSRRRALSHRNSEQLQGRVSTHLHLYLPAQLLHPTGGQLADYPAHDRPLHRRVSASGRAAHLHEEARLHEHGRRHRDGGLVHGAASIRDRTLRGRLRHDGADPGQDVHHRVPHRSLLRVHVRRARHPDDDTQLPLAVDAAQSQRVPVADARDEPTLRLVRAGHQAKRHHRSTTCGSGMHRLQLDSIRFPPPLVAGGVHRPSEPPEHQAHIPVEHQQRDGVPELGCQLLHLLSPQPQLPPAARAHVQHTWQLLSMWHAAMAAAVPAIVLCSDSDARARPAHASFTRTRPWLLLYNSLVVANEVERSTLKYTNYKYACYCLLGHRLGFLNETRVQTCFCYNYHFHLLKCK